jgi:hypothetical protein
MDFQRLGASEMPIESKTLTQLSRSYLRVRGLSNRDFPQTKHSYDEFVGVTNIFIASKVAPV